jgi:predicted nucleotidyltransferase
MGEVNFMINLGSKITSGLLDFFFLNPSAKKYINELAKLLSLDPKNTYRKLVELEEEGLLNSEYRGVEKFYFLNGKFPLLKEYRNIFMKTVGIEKKIRDILAGMTGVSEAYIFGSYAKNKMDVNSDIDLLVIGSHSVVDLQKKINLLQKNVGREINVVNVGKKEFEQKKKSKDPFLSRVMGGSLISLK